MDVKGGMMERRHSLRAPVHGTAVLTADGGTLAGAIENLSLGGVLLRGWLARDVDSIDLDLHLPAARVFTTGTALRRRDERVAVRFDPLSADAEDAIEDEIVRALGAARMRPVLVVDGVEDRRLDIADALRDREMTPMLPRTPLEVVDTMTREQHIEVCVVGSRFGDLRGADLAHFLHDTYPWLKILVIGNDAPALADDVRATLDECAW